MAEPTTPIQTATMFRPPLAAGMKVLDRNFFQKTVQLKAARIFNNKNISAIRTQLQNSNDILREERISSIAQDPDQNLAKDGRKCVLLRPEFQAASEHGNGHANGEEKLVPWPHSPIIAELLQQGLISLIPYSLNLDYKYWTYHDIITSILPASEQTEVPSGFSQVGHVAHLNLREQYLPYKDLIAEILMDKNPSVRTVINKIDDVGEENEFRTFKYEVLAGPDDMNVTVSESNCTFSFDYSKVYWNTRLHTEHARLVDMFQPGEAVCDVMAGIGPFAVPAGRKGCFVWANDLNPDSYSSLQDALKKNKVEEYVQAFNDDGRDFIRNSAARLLDEVKFIAIKSRISRRDRSAGRKEIVMKRILQPKTFQHYALNLPASALTFLSSFVGLYPPELRKGLPEDTKMPLVHVYTFSTKDEFQETISNSVDDAAAGVNALSMSENADLNDETMSAAEKICIAISEQLGYKMSPGSINADGGVEVHDVRDVAPKKRMFCATFRLPEAVAFRSAEK
jgi:tRNA (guanine37-N1)-methyltransferase